VDRDANGSKRDTVELAAKRVDAPPMGTFSVSRLKRVTPFMMPEAEMFLSANFLFTERVVQAKVITTTW